jgi:hypothetical protein
VRASVVSGPSGGRVPFRPMTVAKDAPTTELGAQSDTGLAPGVQPLGWGGFVEDFEHVPDWTWPSSVHTAHTMRSDTQVDSLHLGTTSAVRDMRWSIDPNGAPAAIVERIAEDVGLPIRGHEDDHVPISAYRFDFDGFLTNALLAPIYGHFYFEQVGEINLAATEWRLTKLAPRHPRTIAEIVSARDGGLKYIRQNIAGVTTRGAAFWGDAPPIPVDRLVAFVWRQEAGSWVGRSMLRSMYREWLVKDRVIRVAAINLERAGGVPVIEGPEGASDGQLRELAQMARQFKVSEGGGGAIPFGSKLHLAGANAPSAIDLLRYCDEAMARVWALMLIQLGQTQTGSRALGGEFTSYAGRAQRALAGWIANVFTRHVILDYVRWNLGEDQRYAPRLHFESGKPDALATEELVSLVDAGVLTVDPELEAWLRNERGLPVKPEGLPAAGDPDLVEPPAPPALVPAPAAVPVAAVEAMGAAAESRRRIIRAARAESRRAIYAAVALPERTLRREPNEHEVRAAVDFRALDEAHATLTNSVRAFYLGSVIPAQVKALGEQVVTTKAGTPRKVLTRAAMAKLDAPEHGRDELRDLLLEAARGAAAQAVAEIAEQGREVAMPSDATLRASVTDQADAVTSMAAHGISLSAQRKASQLVGSGLTPEQAAEALETHLSGMAHQWTTDQLQGAVQQAQNAGRFAVFASVGTGVELTAYSSEILDTNTCGPCADEDGTEYASVAEAMLAYASGGFIACEGGPRCRGTAVVVLDETDPTS